MHEVIIVIHGIGVLQRNFKAMTGLREWSSAHQSDETFNSIDFFSLLPKTGDEAVGRAYWLYKPHLEPWHQGNILYTIYSLNCGIRVTFCIHCMICTD